MRLKQKMFIGSAFLAVLPVVITAYFTSITAAKEGEQALTDRARSHITSIRDTKKAQIEDYFNLVANQIKSYADSRSMIEAMRGFKESYAKFLVEAVPHNDEGPPSPQTLPISQYRDALSKYYEKDFMEEYGIQNQQGTQGNPDMRAMLNQLSDNMIALQYFYIAANPNPLGTKEEFFAAKDASTYTQIHRTYHPYINDFQRRFKFADIFLIDADNGHIVYSVLKQIDFATSLTDGPFAKTKLGEIYEASGQLIKGQHVLVDYAPYLPSYENQAAFIAVPIYDGNQKIGILVF